MYGVLRLKCDMFLIKKKKKRKYIRFRLNYILLMIFEYYDEYYVYIINDELKTVILTTKWFCLLLINIVVILYFRIQNEVMRNTQLFRSILGLQNKLPHKKLKIETLNKLNLKQINLRIVIFTVKIILVCLFSLLYNEDILYCFSSLTIKLVRNFKSTYKFYLLKGPSFLTK